MRSGVKRVISVFALLARSSFYKILGILTLMIIGETVLFRRELLKCNNVAIGLVTAPEALIENALVHGFFLGALGLIVVVLVWTEVRMSEKAGYTMMRLHLTRRQLFAIKTVYNVCCFVLLFVVQIWLVLGMLWQYRIFVEVDYEMPQLLFLTFYRNRFLHCLLPMQELGKWIRNVLMITALSMGAAGVIAFPGEKGRNRYPLTLNLAILMILWFVSDAGKNLLDMCCDIVFLGGIAWELLKVYGVFGRQEPGETENGD